jgi:hypothetical protein
MCVYTYPAYVLRNITYLRIGSPYMCDSFHVLEECVPTLQGKKVQQPERERRQPLTKKRYTSVDGHTSLISAN